MKINLESVKKFINEPDSYYLDHSSNGILIAQKSKPETKDTCINTQKVAIETLKDGFEKRSIKSLKNYLIELNAKFISPLVDFVLKMLGIKTNFDVKEIDQIPLKQLEKLVSGAYNSFLAQCSQRAIDEAKEALETWSTRGGAKENRAEGKKRILEAFSMSASSLDLSGLQLREIPSLVGFIFSLKTLDLSKNRLNECNLPESICQLNGLTKLSIKSCGLKYLPEKFHFLSNLETLDLEFNNLSSIPQEFDQLKKLTAISLRHNQKLDFAPEAIKRLLVDGGKFGTKL